MLTLINCLVSLKLGGTYFHRVQILAELGVVCYNNRNIVVFVFPRNWKAQFIPAASAPVSIHPYVLRSWDGCWPQVQVPHLFPNFGTSHWNAVQEENVKCLCFTYSKKSKICTVLSFSVYIFKSIHRLCIQTSNGLPGMRLIDIAGPEGSKTEDNLGLRVNSRPKWAVQWDPDQK